MLEVARIRSRTSSDTFLSRRFPRHFWLTCHFLSFYLLGDDFLYNKMHIFANPVESMS